MMSLWNSKVLPPQVLLLVVVVRVADLAESLVDQEIAFFIDEAQTLNISTFIILTNIDI